MDAEKQKMLDRLLAECDRVRERVSKMSQEDRTKLRWSAFATMYRVKVPFGVNPNRFKKFRRRFKKTKLWNEKHWKEVRKSNQREGRNPKKKLRELVRSQIPYK